MTQTGMRKDTKHALQQAILSFLVVELSHGIQENRPQFLYWEPKMSINPFWDFVERVFGLFTFWVSFAFAVCLPILLILTEKESTLPLKKKATHMLASNPIMLKVKWNYLLKYQVSVELAYIPYIQYLKLETLIIGYLNLSIFRNWTKRF